MAFRSTAPSHLVLAGLAMAGAFAGSVGTAAAQYYGYQEEYYPRGYYERYAPLPPAPIPPRAVGRIAARDLGLAQVDRLVRSGSAYVIDGQSFRGRRERLILDAYSGELIDRIVLPAEPPRRVARLDPREDVRPAPRIVPRPPERPAALKAPSQATAPATIDPSAPAAEPAKPGDVPATTASVPAREPIPSTAAPAAPTPGSTNPATGEAKPQLVNPNDVRGTEGTERQPPLARAEPIVDLAIPPVELPPVRIEGTPPAQ